MVKIDDIELKDYTAMNLLAQWADDRKKVDEENRKLHERINRLDMKCDEQNKEIVNQLLRIQRLEDKVRKLENERTSNNKLSARQLESP